MKHYLEPIEAVFLDVDSTAEGLSQAEAERRLAANGKNKLAEAEKESLIKRFFAQMMDPMILILLAAAAISMVLSIVEKEFPTDVVVILLVVIVNAALGVYQESKADKAIEALHEMAASTTKVLRDGEILHVKSEDLVVGDVILLEAGDAIPADCRIIESVSIKIEEAALTGESVPVGKLIEKLLGKESEDIPLGDRKNMAYMGSTLVYGRGKAVVTGTGMNTEMGKIADAIAQAEEGETPLQIKLTQLSKYLTILTLGICVFIFIFRIAMLLFQKEALHFDFVLESFMLAVSLAVAAIPEGLVAVVTVALSIGVTNMAKKQAIIRKLTAVETLGCAQIICSDKTGTLTQNKMTVTEHAASDEQLLATAMALCTGVHLLKDGTVDGEPTEAALVTYALGLGLNKNELETQSPRVGEAPFDSNRKMMSSLHQTEEGFIQYTKGAPDVVINKCVKIEWGGQLLPLTDELREDLLAKNKGMADQALRVLAAACRCYTEMPASLEAADLEQELVFIGLTGMMDPVRPEVKASIVECRMAGITPVMITGDHKDTAIAIARELDILQDTAQAITGAELDKISDADFQERVTEFSVYARVQPEHKVRIVNAWRKKGMVTAMTGDGVNDAPSIKNADIGVGMGISGTDVTKNVADMVLADDNFATIVSAVGAGRRIYDNIRKTIHFLLSSNLSEVLSIFFATVLNFTILRTPHLLFINLVTDCFPALALGMEEAERDIMRRRPRSPKAGVFADGLGIDALYQGVLVTALTMTAFFIGEFLQTGHWQFTNIPLEDCTEGISMAFLTMNMCEIFHSFNMRSQRSSVIKMELTGSHNKYLYLSMIAALIMSSVVVTVPFFVNAFGFDAIDATEYGISILLAFSVIPIVEFVKLFQRMNTKRKAP